MISVIIPTYRNPKYLDLCLKSITENKVLDTTQVIVVIDGFVEESQDIVDKYEGIYCISLEENMGMQHAINVGVMQASNEYVFVVNDDNVFPPKWDRRLLIQISNAIATHEYEPWWVMTVNQLEPSGPSMFNFNIVDAGTTVETFNRDVFEDADRRLSIGEIEVTGGIFPFVVQKKYFLAVGGLDTLYDSPNFCDWDFFLKLELLGFKFLRTHGLHLYHFGSVATKKNEERQRFLQRELDAASTYQWKWGAFPSNKPGTNSKLPPDGRFRGFKV